MADFNMPTFPRIKLYGTIVGARLANSSDFGGSHLATTRLSMKRLVSLVDKRAVVRASELYPFGVHPHDLSKAARQGLLVKIGRACTPAEIFPRTSNIKSLSLACEYPTV
jgi:hypothetical protein